MKIKLYRDVIYNTFINNNENLETFRYSTTEGQLNYMATYPLGGQLLK